jgi:ferrochelatase
MSQPGYDALLVLSFGGPEAESDVIPFLENVLRGKNVPRERLLEVAEHYYHFGGRSPLNDQNRELIAALEREFAEHGPALPVYWGNRNWHPLLADTVRRMQSDGIRRALVFATSAFGSYSGCRQYREDLARAAAAVADAPALEKLRHFYNHPLFVEVMAERVRDAVGRIPEHRRAAARHFFTAHSVPVSMAESGPYVRQLQEACRLVAEAADLTEWQLVYQSRSGPPSQPWLEPDLGDALRAARRAGAADAVVTPIGFLSDHMEVLYDLDTEAAGLAREIGLNLVRAGTAGTHPKFVRMIRALILEKTRGAERKALGRLGPSPDVCSADCCPAPRRPEVRPQ